MCFVTECLKGYRQQLNMLVRILLRFALYNLLTLASCEQSQGNTTTTRRINGFINNNNNDNLTLTKADTKRRIMDMGESQNRKDGGNELLSSTESQTDLYTDNVLPTPRIRANYATTPVSTKVLPKVLGRAASTKENTSYDDSSISNSYKQDMIQDMSNLWNSSFYDNLHNSSNITDNLSDLFNTTITTTSTGTPILGMQPQVGDVSSTTKTKQTEYNSEVTDNNTDSGNAQEKDDEVKSTNSLLSSVQKGKNETQGTGSSATISPYTDLSPGDLGINLLDALYRDRSNENETEDLYHESPHENLTAGTLQENTSASQDLQTVILPTVVTVTSLPRTTHNSTTQVPPTRAPPKKILPEMRIAWLAPKVWNEGFSAETTVNVLKQAISDCKTFLPHTVIRVKWYDTKCTAKDALAAAVDARREFDPDLILGPPCNPGMAGVAMLASHWNLPIFGWVSNDHSLENRSVYTTLVRLLGPLNQFSYTMNFVTILFRWRRFAMIYDVDPAYTSVNDAITLYLTRRNSTVTSQHDVDASMSERQIQIIFQQVRKYARVIVFSVPWMTMRRYMLVAHKLGMTDGDFSFICINGDVYTNKTLYSIVRSDAGWRRNDSDDDKARIAFESVIHVIMATYNLSAYATFAEYVSKAETLKSDLWQLPDGNETIDAYAPFVYDATVLWASLVNKTLLEGGNPRNGSNIFRRAKGIQSTGVTGNLVLDQNCDRLSNVWFLDMQSDGKFKEFVEIYNTLNGGVLKTIENARVRWRDGSTGSKNAPPDSPVCGFEGELCKKVTHQVVPDYTDSIVGAAVGSSFVFIIAVSVQVTLRYYRRRQQLESMLWQVKFEEIDFVTAILSGSVRSSFRNLARSRNSSNKKLSKSDKSLNLDESSPRIHQLFETDAVMFGSVAYVRGSLVSVKKMTRANIGLTKDLLQQLNKLMELKHQNITAFVGACVDPGRILLLWEYCAKGSLQDIILNQNIKLDQLFKFALCQDVAKGLEYIHKSSVNYHGNLKSSNCVVDSRWTCKLTDFGVPKLRLAEKSSIPSEESSDSYWTAPEILRTGEEVDVQKADIFALGVVFKEVFTRSAPYSEYGFMNSVDILRRVIRSQSSSLPFRPLLNGELKNNHELCQLINDCWAEDPSVRPSATKVLKVLGKLNPSKNMTMIDNMLAMLEKYANHLEELVAERTSELEVEKRKTENLLYRMLPQSVAEDLKLGKPVKAELFDQVSIYFSDIVGFTKICAESTPIEVVNLLNSLYTLFDDIITRYDVYKVETIGDAYMLASGLPKRNGGQHTKEIANAALDILASIRSFRIPHLPEKKLKIRIGIHTGPVVAGVVGLVMPRYCLFGDTVNTASRMESTGLPLRIHLSASAKQGLENFKGYHIEYRGDIEVKGKGLMPTYFLLGKDGFSKVLPNPAEYDGVSPKVSRAGETRFTSPFGDDARFEDHKGCFSLSKNTSRSLLGVQEQKRGMPRSASAGRIHGEDGSLNASDTNVISSTDIILHVPDDDVSGSVRNVQETQQTPPFHDLLLPDRYVNRGFDHSSYAGIGDSGHAQDEYSMHDKDELYPNTTPNKTRDLLKLTPSKVSDLLLSPMRYKKSRPSILSKKSYKISSLTSRENQLTQNAAHSMPRRHSTEVTSDKNPLEYLFRNYSGADTNNVSPGSRHESKTAIRRLDLTTNVFPTVAYDNKCHDQQLGIPHCDGPVGDHYGHPKRENTQFRNSPILSCSLSPKLDVGLLKEQINSRMSKAMDMTPL